MSTLVLLRHGQSAWNAENRFTGWIDVDLSAEGEAEAHQAGKLLGAEEGLVIDIAFTSVLTRAVLTADIALAEAGRSFIPVHRHWRLNERHYGTLQGLNKAETAKKFGDDQVRAWRRSYDVPPPPLSLDDPRHPINDARYANIPPRSLPATECLADVVVRLLPYFEDAIAPELLSGHTVCVIAHGNSLRALVKYLEDISDGDIMDLEIPTGVPRIYELDANLAVKGAHYLGSA
jgi:2,3-bisphosphoglycerate-dependent phosphoglycerate mutase